LRRCKSARYRLRCYRDSSNPLERRRMNMLLQPFFLSFIFLITGLNGPRRLTQFVRMNWTFEVTDLVEEVRATLTFGFEYCIYTQDNGSLAAIVAKYFDSFTLIPSMSFWKGQTTTNACVTILCEEPCPERVEHLIEEIMVRNKSESVLLTILRLHDVELITRSITKAEMFGGCLIGLAETDFKEGRTGRNKRKKPERS